MLAQTLVRWLEHLSVLAKGRVLLSLMLAEGSEVGWTIRVWMGS